MVHLGQFLVPELEKAGLVTKEFEKILACVCSADSLLKLQSIYKVDLGYASGRRSRPAIILKAKGRMKVFFLTTRKQKKELHLTLCSFKGNCCPQGYNCFDVSKRSFVMYDRAFDLNERWLKLYFFECGDCIDMQFLESLE